MCPKIFFVMLLAAFSTRCFSQQFISSGKIEYERKTNQHAFLDENNPWDEVSKKNLPKFVTYYFDLSFNAGRSLYKPGREPETRQNRYWGVSDGDNIIATDIENNTSVTQKGIYGESFLITDSVRKIDWKIGTEVRKIAGFDCRKAVGRVMDSITVIAFYTDEILPSGGPESFTGLPGMILGIAVPKMHTTWYATKLQLETVSAAELADPKKGKKMAGTDFRKQLKSLLKNRGGDGARMEWQWVL